MRMTDARLSEQKVQVADVRGSGSPLVKFTMRSGPDSRLKDGPRGPRVAGSGVSGWELLTDLLGVREATFSRCRRG